MNQLRAMIHVPDVAATAAWYASIGFTVDRTFSDGEETTWASVSFGDGSFMLNAGGRPSDAHRREVDLYVTVEDVDYASLPLMRSTPIVVASEAKFEISDVKQKPSETVWFSWIVYRNRKHRDAVMKQVMKDKRLASMMSDPKAMPFDGKRMIFGGFKTSITI